MSPQAPEPSRREIGASLRDARRRLDIEVKEVEERTKIRARYIRALENEDWETLPAPAYVRGFIRTYGQMLGLDGEMLADEYRRRSAGTEQTTSSGLPGEPVLTERQRPATRSLSRGRLIVGLGAGLVAVLLLLSLLPGGDDDGDAPSSPTSGRQGAEAGKEGLGRSRRKQRRPVPLRIERLRFEAITDVTACIVADDEARVDRQVLGLGSIESFDDATRYRVDIVGGVGRLRIGDEEMRIEADDEGATFRADSRGIRPLDYKGPRCP